VVNADIKVHVNMMKYLVAENHIIRRYVSVIISEAVVL